jgi:uncharacterized protein
MTELFHDSALVKASRARVWEVVNDADALRRIIPGCEELVADGPSTYRAVMRTRLPFMTLRTHGSAAIAEEQYPAHFELRITGRPLGLVGSFSVRVPIDLTEEQDGAATRAEYRIDLELSGRLATFGAPMLKSTVKGQIKEMLRNLEAELAVAQPPSGTAP